ncbi:MAG: TldD/PmbA family protein [Lachnospiraceae bacterium]|nr:TldD/PmbA family protein [Lachnospiraceae bacterium]
MQVDSSAYLTSMKPLYRALLDSLLEDYGYASVLAADVDAKDYSVARSGISISENVRFGKRGFVVRVYTGEGYAEYSGNELSREKFPEIKNNLSHNIKKSSEIFTRYQTAVSKDEPLCFVRATEYETDPHTLGDEAIIEKLSAVRREGLAKKPDLIDCSVRFSYQCYHKLFLSPHRDLEQNCLWTSAGLSVTARRGEEVKNAYKSLSLLGGAELLEELPGKLDSALATLEDVLKSEPLVPGTYECVCTPEVTGMIVHEAFGHGVEMDMFVKDRALAASHVGKMVASPLVTMRDGAATGYDDVATFFFDDEGNTAQDTLIIDKGMLVSGICDEVSASRLGVRPTGNGRREAIDHKAYTRMTNTYFLEGNDKVEDMIASVKDGLLLEDPSSGMEDPKNWGIQCMVSFAREIKDGRLTGRIFSPIVLSGYVPDLLKSITMISGTVEHAGGGFCGKGWKEWVKVSDGGPYIKATIRLG